MTKITRIEVIDENGRSYVNWEDDNDVSYQLQDDGRTLKVFVSKVKPKSPVEEAYKDWWGEYPTEYSTETGQIDLTIWQRWQAFQAGYNAIKEETAQEPEKSKINDLAETLLPDDHPYKIADEYGELNPYKQYLNSVKDEKKMEELGFVKNSDGSWTAQPLGETAQERGEKVHKEMEEKLQEKEWSIKVVTDYLTGKSRHKLNIVDKDGNDYQPKPHTTEELLKPNWKPKPQTEEQKFKEIPELLDQLDALSEFHPLPTAVWRDIRKLMFLSYDKGYSKGGYDTHMKYAGTD